MIKMAFEGVRPCRNMALNSLVLFLRWGGGNGFNVRVNLLLVVEVRKKVFGFCDLIG